MEVPPNADRPARVDQRFRALGPRHWESPAQRTRDDYSRVSDPEKYVITQQRAAAWIDSLVAEGLAETSETEGRVEPYGSVTTTRLTPARTGADAVDVHFTRDVLRGVVLWSVGAPAPLVTVPLCGCDHCDYGSEGFVQEIDAAFAGLAESWE